MSETIDVEKARSPSPAWLAIPLALFALISLTVGLIARGAIRQPYPTPFFHLFFSDTFHMNVWLITAAVVLGFFQLLTAAHIYQLLRFLPPGRLYNLVHRFSGYTAAALTVPVAYHCIFLLGFGAGKRLLRRFEVKQSRNRLGHLLLLLLFWKVLELASQGASNLLHELCCNGV